MADKEEVEKEGREEAANLRREVGGFFLFFLCVCVFVFLSLCPILFMCDVPKVLFTRSLRTLNKM